MFSVSGSWFGSTILQCWLKRNSITFMNVWWSIQQCMDTIFMMMEGSIQVQPMKEVSKSEWLHAMVTTDEAVIKQLQCGLSFLAMMAILGALVAWNILSSGETSII